MSKTFEGLWIPLEILLGKSFTAIQKIVLAEVFALQGTKGCFASNAHFAAITGVQERMVRKHISKLAADGFLLVENPTSKRRRLWVSAAVDEQPQARLPSKERLGGETVQDSSTPLVENSDPHNPGTQIPGGGANSCVATRNQRPAQPGTKSGNPVNGDLETRNEGATENIVRTQEENTKENTCSPLAQAVSPLTGTDDPFFDNDPTWRRWCRHRRNTRACEWSDTFHRTQLYKRSLEGHRPQDVLDWTMEKGPTYWEPEDIYNLKPWLRALEKWRYG